jgi:hypothetical protein
LLKNSNADPFSVFVPDLVMTSLQRVYDPFTGDMATGQGRVQFANNVIPANRLNAISRQLLALYPLPNVQGTGAGGFTGNYQTTRDSNTDATTTTSKSI